MANATKAEKSAAIALESLLVVTNELAKICWHVERVSSLLDEAGSELVAIASNHVTTTSPVVLPPSGYVS